jgi:hypothetical protein
MKRMTMRRVVTLLAVLAFAACDETGFQPFDPALSLDEETELSVLQDPGSLDITVELADASAYVAASFDGTGTTDGHALIAQARLRFQAAHDALLAGDRPRALEIAREARRLAAQAIVATGGAEAVEALIEHIEELALSLDPEDDDVFDDPELLRERLERLAAAARQLLAEGRLVAAAERALLGEQFVRFHRGRRDHRGEVLPERARLAVALGGTAVALAERLVAAEDIPFYNVSDAVTDRQNRWLAHARHMLQLAEQALANEHFARAVHFAWHAQWSALKAVILPGGVTEEELRAMVELANGLYEEAVAAVGDDPTELEQRLLGLAGRLIERGEQMLAEGYPRGVAALWRAAVLSSWLVA